MITIVLVGKFDVNSIMILLGDFVFLAATLIIILLITGPSAASAPYLE
jgi:hypothetical protein